MPSPCSALSPLLLVFFLFNFPRIVASNNLQPCSAVQATPALCCMLSSSSPSFFNHLYQLEANDDTAADKDLLLQLIPTKSRPRTTIPATGFSSYCPYSSFHFRLLPMQIATIVSYFPLSIATSISYCRLLLTSRPQHLHIHTSSVWPSSPLVNQQQQQIAINSSSLSLTNSQLLQALALSPFF